MDTVTISLRKYHKYLDYEKFVNEQDKVFIRDLSETEAVLIGKTEMFKIFEDTNQELVKEVERLKDEVEKLEDKVNDNTLREQLEENANVDSELSNALFNCNMENDNLRFELKKLRNLSFWQKVKRLFK